MWKSIAIASALPFVLAVASFAAQPSRPIDEVIQLYVQALGGAPALDQISSRQLETKGGEKATYIWQAPNKVLRMRGPVREGFDGKVAWLETRRKKVQKLPRSVEAEIETDANPDRYARLHDLFTDLETAPRESLDGAPMDIIVAPNHIGNTKLFFDASTHLLSRIEEFGLYSAYFKHIIEFSDYKEFDGIKIPTRINRESDEPGAEKGETRLLKIKQNIEVNTRLFERPDIAPTVLGGK
jgi:hypothetical protein